MGNYKGHNLERLWREAMHIWSWMGITDTPYGPLSIGRTDKRGWYIAMGCVNYLYSDGVVRNGADNPQSNCFWATKHKAEQFYSEWQRG